ncbi:MAG: diphosphate--fructose-6-phosphate 1-phosphotransferase, partial [Candidatus Binatia bacterium]
RNIEGVRIAHDSYGHLRLAEVDLAVILKTLVEHRFANRGTPITIVHKDIGYELRCAAPIAFDCDYVRTLGYGAVEFLLNPDAASGKLDGALVCLINGKLEHLDFAALQDPTTGKTRVRPVDINKPSYKVAREYMIRLDREDFADTDKLRLLAQSASTKDTLCSPDEFKNRFQYLTTELHGSI